MSYYDDEQVRLLTRLAIEQSGSRLLQIHRFSEDERRHIATLLDVFMPPPRCRILDVGCGVGETARMMTEQRPDLRFTLANISAAQLELCPEQFPRVQASAERLPFARGDFDALMVTYALGHFDLAEFAQQAMVLLPPGGHLYLFDLFSAPYRGTRLNEELNYAERTVDDVTETFEQHRFVRVACAECQKTPDAILGMMPSPHTLDGTLSAALVFIKEP